MLSYLQNISSHISSHIDGVTNNFLIGALSRKPLSPTDIDLRALHHLVLVDLFLLLQHEYQLGAELHSLSHWYVSMLSKPLKQE